MTRVQGKEVLFWALIRSDQTFDIKYINFTLIICNHAAMFMYSEHSDWFVDKEILKEIPNDSSIICS